MIIQLCGLPAAGKTTISYKVKEKLFKSGILVDVIDGDEYRNKLCKDLSFSKEDRNENIRRLGFVAGKLATYNIIAIISAINPYQEIRDELTRSYPDVKTVWVRCPVEVLIQRDTKGLYKRALLPEGHPEKINNLTGISDPFEEPKNPDMVIDTGSESAEESAAKLCSFILARREIF